MNNKNLLLAFIAVASLSGSVLAYQHRFYNDWINPVKVIVHFEAASDNEWIIEPDGGTDYDDVGGLWTNSFGIFDMETKRWIRSKFIKTNRQTVEFPASPDANNVPETGSHGYTVRIKPDPNYNNTQPIAIISR